jgi:hypothetical protein
VSAAAQGTPKQRIAWWFRDCGWTPFRFQREAWNAYLRGESGLVHANTGTVPPRMLIVANSLTSGDHIGTLTLDKRIRSYPVQAPKDY